MASGLTRCPSCGRWRDEGRVVTKGTGWHQPVGADDPDDIFVATDDTPPGRGRRRRRDVVVLLAVAGLLVAGLALLGADGEAPSRRSSGSGTTTSTTRPHSSRPRPTTTRPTADQPAATVVTQPVPTAVLAGLAPGLAVALVTNDGLAYVDLDTGAVTRVRINGCCWAATAAAGGVVYTGERGAGFDHRDRAEPLDLGAADSVFPSDEAGRVWLATWSYGPVLREVDLATGEEQARITLPDNAQPVGTVTGGIVVGRSDGVFVLHRDGSSERVTRGQAIAAGGDSVLYTTCRALDACELRVLDLAGGEDRLVDVDHPFPWTMQSPSFSPDGEALVVVVGNQQSGEVTDLYVVTLATGEVEKVPIAPSVAGSMPAWGWSPGGHDLFVMVSDDLLAYRPGHGVLATGELASIGVQPSGQPVLAVIPRA